MSRSMKRTDIQVRMQLSEGPGLEATLAKVVAGSIFADIFVSV